MPQGKPWEKYQAPGPWSKYREDPDAAIKALQAEKYPTPSETGVTDNRTTAQVARDQALLAVKGAAGLPGAMLAAIPEAGGALHDMVTGKGSGRAQDLLSEAAAGFVNLHTTPVRGAAAVAAPGSVEAPTREAWEEHAQAAGANLASLAVPSLAGTVFKSVGGRLTSKGKALYQSALKPSPALTEAARSRIIQTALRERIPVSQAGANKLSDLIDSLNDTIQQKIDTGQRQGVTVSPVKAAARVNDITPVYTNQANPIDDLRAIGSSKNEFLAQHMTPGKPAVAATPAKYYGSSAPSPAKPAVPPKEIPIPASRAQQIKIGTYRQLKDKAYAGTLKPAAVEAQKQIARGIKEELEHAFPELRTENARLGGAIELDTVLERALARIGNQQLIGIGTPITAAAGAAVTGSGKMAAAAGLMKAVLDNPAVKSHLAITLTHAAPRVSPAAARAAAALRLQAYLSGLHAQSGRNTR